MTTTIAQLALLLADEGLLAQTPDLTPAQAETLVSGADCDSRVAASGHVFVCKGTTFRDAYLEAAASAGAVAYVADVAQAPLLAKAAPTLPALLTSDVRRAMAVVSAEAWGHPDARLHTVGVTGTKGKTTVTHMLRAILDEGSGEPRSGIIGSVETFDGVSRGESHNTTPEAPDLWRHLANAVDAGLTHMVMEVSSQGLKYDRVRGLHLDVACFLNIGHDHISPTEHPSFDDYFASKLRIFGQADTAVVNLDTNLLPQVLEAARTCDRLATFSATSAQADVWASDVHDSLGTVSFVAHTPGWEAPVRLAMPGTFNVDNALAAIAMADVCGCTREQVVSALAHVHVPGRMELLQTTGGRVVGLVDYAHNALSYQRLFPALKREFPGYGIVVVMGAAGDKAQERRRELPPLAARYADHLIFTANHPGHERVEDICAEMEAATPAGTPCETIPNREEAIAHAVDLAYDMPGHTIVAMLSKGDEAFQHIGDSFVPCRTDAELFREAARRHA